MNKITTSRLLFAASALLAATTASAFDNKSISNADEYQAKVINGCVLEPGTKCPGVDLRGADLSHLDLRANRREGYNVTAARWESAGGAIADINCAVGSTPCLTAAEDEGFTIDEAEVIYWGTCPACQQKPRD